MADEATSKVLNQGLDPLAQDPHATADYTKDVSELLTKVDTLEKANRVQEAVEEIMALEKKCRMASDAISCSQLICRIVQLYYTRKDMDKVHEYIKILARKRGQLKRAISDLVLLVMKWLDEIEEKEKFALITTLCEVTEGKIFVEVERARLTKLLAEDKEKKGDIDGACELMQEVQVETFGAMERREKAEYILEQMRLTLLKKDYIRTQIVSKKINPKLLEADDFQDIKLSYFEHMVRYNLHEGNYMEVCKNFQSMFKTQCIQDNAEKWKPMLESLASYLLLTPYDNEQQDLLNKLVVVEKKKMSELPVCLALVKGFLEPELLDWPPANEQEVKTLSIFQDKPLEGGADRWKLFRQRVVQKNIRIISLYYSTIRLKHLADILKLSQQETEKELTELVSNKFLHVRIDRPEGTMKFGLEKAGHENLNTWGNSIFSALELMEESCHRIQKEQMIHATRSKVK